MYNIYIYIKNNICLIYDSNIYMIYVCIIYNMHTYHIITYHQPGFIHLALAGFVLFGWNLLWFSHSKSTIKWSLQIATCDRNLAHGFDPITSQNWQVPFNLDWAHQNKNQNSPYWFSNRSGFPLGKINNHRFNQSRRIRVLLTTCRDPLTGSTVCGWYGGFHKYWYPNSWMLYFMENPSIIIYIWMIWGYPHDSGNLHMKVPFHEPLLADKM